MVCYLVQIWHHHQKYKYIQAQVCLGGWSQQPSSFRSNFYRPHKKSEMMLNWESNNNNNNASAQRQFLLVWLDLKKVGMQSAWCCCLCRALLMKIDSARRVQQFTTYSSILDVYYYTNVVRLTSFVIEGYESLIWSSRSCCILST